MERLQRIYQKEFLEEWNRAYDDWYGKFSLHAIEPIRCYWNGYGEVHFDPISDFWCHIWNGPHCIYGRKELIPGVTIVTVITSVNCSPMFLTPREVIEKFEFSNRNPFTNKWDIRDTPYRRRLLLIEEQIRKNAAAQA